MLYCIQRVKLVLLKYYQSSIEAHKGDQRSLFKHANQLLNKKNDNILPSFDDPKEMANDIAKLSALGSGSNSSGLVSGFSLEI